ncbi:MAG: DNRLRE domain-containing protein [Chloroflexi bacterium]|nr:DNRLRE domain-containing protein [Chloroflexota bacterium]
MERSNLSKPIARWVPGLALAIALTLIFSGAVSAFPRSRGGELLADPLPDVYFAPSPAQVGIGGTTAVDVMVDNVQGLYAVELRVSFPNSLVHVVDADSAQLGTQIQPGDIFAGFDTYVIQNRADNATGLVEYIVSITGSLVGKTGSGTIATIPLQGLVEGEAVMSFVEVILAERDGTSIDFSYASTYVDIEVTPSPATATPTRTPTPSTAPLLSPTPTRTHTPGPSPTSTRTPTPTQTYTPGPPPQTQVRVVPATQGIGIGDTSIVQIEVHNVTDLYGFDVRVDYNGALLDVEDADPGLAGIQVWNGDVFNGLGYQILENWVYDDGVFGQVHFAANLNTGYPSGVGGDAILFWIIFRGVTPGLSAVNLAEVQLVNHAGNTIARSLQHGQIDVTLEGASVTPSITSTPSRTPTGTLSPSPTYTSTPSRTLQPGETIGPEPTSTATQTGVLVTPTPVCADRIQNGGFEQITDNEAPPWVRSGSVNFTTIEQHSGVRSAWFGGYNNADDKLCQQVTIPAHPEPGQETTQALLSYWWGMLTNDAPPPSDYLYVRVRDAAGDLLETLETLSETSTSGRWEESQFDLSAYKGQTVQICFEAVTDGAQTTSFFVDDVSLIVCEILLPTATPTFSPTPTHSATPTETGLPTATPTISPTPVEQVLQQNEGVYEGCRDSYLNQWEPKTNYGHQGALSVRTGSIKRPIVYFDVSSIPAGVTILEAKLELYTSHYKSHAFDMTVSVYGLKRLWQEMETSWDVARTDVPWGLPGAEDTTNDRDAVPVGSQLVSATNTWYAFDVTSLVQQWVNGARPNYGMLLDATGNTVEMSFWSSEYSIRNLRPRLVVRYIYGALPTPTFTPLASATPGPSPTATFTPLPGGTTIVLQEGNLGYSGTQDTYISQWQPTTNYGGNVTMTVRQGHVRSSLIRFDLSGLPAGATIQSATLSLYAVSRSNAGNLTVDLYEVLRAWTEGQATWELARTGRPWAQAGCSQPVADLAVSATSSQFVNDINTWFQWDVTSLVQAWVANPAANQGMILKGDGPTSVEYSFATSDYWWNQQYAPKLTIRYTT